MAKAHKRISTHDLAAELGVSVSTVSRVLNNAPDVSEATKAQVRALAEKLHYHPTAWPPRCAAGAATCWA